MKTLMLVIKVTHACNLNCTYCYDKELKSSNKFICSNLVEQIIKWTANYVTDCNIDQITFVWHGGEPLLAGEKFFNDIIFLQEKFLKNVKCVNGIQTNGTLLDEELVGVLKQHRFKISVSLDGGEIVTNASRRYINGTGAYNDIIKGIEILKKNNIKFGISMVIHEGNVSQLIEIYDYFKTQNINFDFVPSFSAELNESYLKQFALSIVDLFKHWYYDENCLSIGFFNDLIRSIVTEKIHHCNFDRDCCNGDNILVVDINGDLYPCSTLVFDKDFCFGNISEIRNREDIESSLAYNKIRYLNNLSLEECKACNVNKYCNSGCFVRSLKGVEKDFYCEGWYSLINCAIDILKNDGILLERS